MVKVLAYPIVRLLEAFRSWRTLARHRLWRRRWQNVRSRKSRETPSGITGFLRTDGLMTVIGCS